MKTLFIVGTYPTTNKHKSILYQCVEAIKRFGFDVLIVSHTNIPDNVFNLTDYFIYDKNNTFLPALLSPHFWVTTDQFYIQINNEGHTLPICRNMKNGFELAKARGYEAFVFMESDIIMSEIDMETLKDYLLSIQNDGKEMFFFRPEEYRGTNNSYVYETLLFGGKTTFILDNLNLPTNLLEWSSYKMGFTLEQTFYEKLCQHENKFLIINDHSSNVFLDSKVNIFRYGLVNCEMIYNDCVPSEPVLFINNSFIDDNPKYVSVIVDGNLTNHILYKGQYWFSSYKLGEVHKIDVMVYEDEDKKELLISKSYDIDEKSIKNFIKRGIIKIK